MKSGLSQSLGASLRVESAGQRPEFLDGWKVHTRLSLHSGVNCLYVRVAQTNGQMAWSSPVWVEYPV